MSIKDNLYPKRTPSDSYYSGSTNGGAEPDMRQAMINFLDGSWPEVAKKQTGLLRKMSRDSNDRLVPCDCVDDITHEPDKDNFCPVCFGVGNIWTEDYITFYKTLEDSDQDNALLNKHIEPGLINVPLVVFYVRYSANITKDDQIVELVLDSEGDVQSPVKRRNIYKIGIAWDYRSDNGRIEYWKLFTQVINVRYLNAPQYGE